MGAAERAVVGRRNRADRVALAQIACLLARDRRGGWRGRCGRGRVWIAGLGTSADQWRGECLSALNHLLKGFSGLSANVDIAFKPGV